MSHAPIPSADRASARALRALMRRGGAPLGFAIAAPLVAGLLLLPQALLLSRALGDSIMRGLAVETVWPALVGIGALIALRAVLTASGEQAGQIAAERIKTGLRGRLFARVLAVDDRGADRPASGTLSAQIVDQVESLEPFFARYVPAMVSAAFLPIAFGLVILPVDWVVALLFLCSAPLIPVFMALVGWGAQAATDRQATALARLSGYTADRLRGLLTLKLFGRAQDTTESVHKASESLRKRTANVLRIAFLSSAVLEFFAALGVAGVALYVGLTFLGFLSIHPELTLQMGLFCLLMAPEVYAPLRTLAAHYHDRAAARSAIAEIEKTFGDLMEAPKATEGAGPVRHAFAGAATVTLAGVTVRLPGSAAPVLERLDLTVAAGQHIAIVGPSGVGKSTLLDVLAGLRDHSGQALIDGMPVGSIPDQDLRRRVAYIGQKPKLFFGTITDNIAFANPAATPAEIAAAARAAMVTDFASALPDGLETLLGERGEGLSGGQLQRLALARLFLTDPGLVLLDEPTAHLDPDTERDVLDRLTAFARGRTLVMVTHSAAAAGRMDKIYRMAGGQLMPTVGAFSAPVQAKGVA